MDLNAGRDDIDHRLAGSSIKIRLEWFTMFNIYEAADTFEVQFNVLAKPDPPHNFVRIDAETDK